MRGNRAVIDALNQVLGGELIAINQYFLHARMLGNWGFHRLNREQTAHSTAAMKQADALIERILFFDGRPDLGNLGYLHIGENPAEMLAAARKMETLLLAVLRQALASCERWSDSVSRALLETLLECHERRLHWQEIQLGLIEAMGLENYLQSRA
ncbi:MAG: bacterioferritin [Methylococcaceae bacterium]|nr:bacterioferritin [Methylococcaceae bacterium]